LNCEQSEYFLKEPCLQQNKLRVGLMNTGLKLHVTFSQWTKFVHTEQWLAFDTNVLAKSTVVVDIT